MSTETVASLVGAIEGTILAASDVGSCAPIAGTSSGFSYQFQAKDDGDRCDTNVFNFMVKDAVETAIRSMQAGKGSNVCFKMSFATGDWVGYLQVSSTAVTGGPCATLGADKYQDLDMI